MVAHSCRKDKKVDTCELPKAPLLDLNEVIIIIILIEEVAEIFQELMKRKQFDMS